MKNIRCHNSIISIISIILLSCTNSIYTDCTTSATLDDTSSSIISYDDAIKSLNHVLAEIDPQTRGCIREIKECQIMRVNDYKLDKTRSLSDTTRLIYVVNFEGDSGYAVLSANTQIEPNVIFIADEGYANISDFTDNNNINTSLSIEDLYYEPDDDYYLGYVGTDCNGRLLQQDIIKNIISLRTFPQNDSTLDDLYLPHTIPYANINPLVKTLWHQHYPYNKNFPKKQNSDIDNCPAGCTVIATGQLLTYLDDVDIKTNFNIENTSWKEIELFQVDNNDNQENSDNFDEGYKTLRDNIAIILKHIADKIEVKYNYGIGNAKGTYGRPVKIVNYLESLGYNVNHIKNRPNISVETQDLINRSVEHKYPVLVGALGSCDGSLSGHCWLIDGCKYIETENEWINHINLGWGNHSGNGWYFRNCFESIKEYTPEASSITRLASTGEFNYSWAFNVIIVK